MATKYTYSEELEPLRNENNSVNDRYEYNANAKRTLCDIISLSFFVIFAGGAFAAGAVSLGAGASWYHNMRGYSAITDCIIILITAVVPLGLGGLIVLGMLVTAAVAFGLCAIPKAGLSGVGCCGKIVRITFLHVVPFLSLCIGVAGSIIAFYFGSMAHQLPDLNANFNSVAGLDGPVTISRDGNGLVHISASSRGDALFGQGLAHGQDRLWQVEFQRLVGRGRLGEFVGSAGAKMDKQIRTLGFPAAAQRMCDNASEESKQLTQRYLDGLNFYVQNYKQRPLEFMFMGTSLLKEHVVEPFEPMDSCLIAMLLMWQMGSNIPDEISRFKVFWNTDRTFEQVNELFINQTNITGTILNAEQLNLSEADAVAAREREAEDDRLERDLYDSYIAQLRQQHNPYRGARSSQQQELQKKLQKISSSSTSSSSNNKGSTSSCADKASEEALSFLMKEFDLLNFNVGYASNSWGGRAPGADGYQQPVGASDPHLNINVPSVWYWSHMKWPAGNKTDNWEQDVAGVGLPGLPGVHIGKTNTASWGITMSMTDLEDLYLMVPDPANPDTHYMHNGSSIPYTYRTEVIKVKGADAITLTIPETIYGPIVTVALNLPKELNFAISADFLRNDTSSLDGLLCLNDHLTITAMDVRDKCLSRVRSPGFSIPIEDREGNLVYSMTGAHPLRVAGHTGRYPTLGNGSYDNLGMIPHAELPTTVITAAQSNANGGYISAANQKTYPDGYKYSLSYDFCYPYRGARLHEVLSQNVEKLSDVNFHMGLQRDVRSNIAQDWLSNILNNSNYENTFDVVNAKNDSVPMPAEVTAFHTELATSKTASLWYNRLQNWDREMVIGNVEGTFFWMWWRRLMQIPADAIAALNVQNDGSFATGDNVRSYWDSGMMQLPITMLLNPSSLMTTQCKAFSKFVNGGNTSSGCGYSFATLFIILAESFDESKGSWGNDYNQLTTKHLMLDGTPLDCLFQRTIPKDGDMSTIDVSDFSLPDKMSSSFASSMRQIYDWANPLWIHFVFPGGESGNPFSEFFSNLLKPFSKDEYILVTTSGNIPLMDGTSHTQTLNP